MIYLQVYEKYVVCVCMFFCRVNVKTCDTAQHMLSLSYANKDERCFLASYIKTSAILASK